MSIWAVAVALLQRTPRLQRVVIRIGDAWRARRRSQHVHRARRHIWDQLEDPPRCFFCPTPYSEETRDGECWGCNDFRPSYSSPRPAQPLRDPQRFRW